MCRCLCRFEMWVEGPISGGVFYLLWWVELRGQVSRSSAELEYHWLSWSPVLGWRRGGPADCDWSAAMMWAGSPPPGWSCWPCRTVNQDKHYNTYIPSHVMLHHEMLLGYTWYYEGRLRSEVSTFLESHGSAAAAGIGSSSLIGGGVWKADSGL